MNGTNGKQRILTADLLCLLVAFIWGTGFIASQLAIDAGLGASRIMALRFSVAALVMLVFCLPKIKGMTKHELISGCVAGVFLFTGFFTQILGQQRTTISHCAFLTATDVIMVPFIMWAFNRRRPPLRNFLIAAMTLAGVGILSFSPGGSDWGFHAGDGLSLLCAFLFALHISCMQWAARDSDAMRINFIQLTVAAVLSLLVFLLTGPAAAGTVDWGKGIPAVLFLGVFSTCLCFFLQTWAQKYTSPSHAGVLLSTEGLFGSVFSVILGMEAISVNLVAGGLVILLSVVLLELSPAEK